MQATTPHAPTCGAKTRDGDGCKNAPMPNGRCRMHGGKSLGGIASPSLKHGKHSKYLPARLKDAYETAQADDDLLALRSEIALTDARLNDVLGRVETGEAGATYRKLQVTYADLMDALAAKNAADQAVALRAIGDLIERGMADYAAWDEIGRLMEQRRRLVETERKRLVDMQQMITSERAVLLITTIAGIIRDHVTDTHTLANISRAIGALLNRDAPAEINTDY